MPKTSVNCSRFHSLVSLPNLLGESNAQTCILPRSRDSFSLIFLQLVQYQKLIIIVHYIALQSIFRYFYLNDCLTSRDMPSEGRLENVMT